MLTFETALPEETGVPSGCIIDFIERLRKHEVPMHSLLIMHHDKLITEGYYAPCTEDTLHRMFSVSKSFTAIAIGLLADEGKLSLDDPIIKYFPDKVPEDVHPWIAAMTIRDMLMMRTCHASTTYKLDMAKDWVESFFTTPPTHPAGKIFHYDTSSAHTLCALAERLSGRPMLTYIKEKLPELDLSKESYMIKDPFGVSLGGSGLVATSMDLMKFGYFIYHKGNINGKQLLSQSYIEQATSLLTDTAVTAPVASEACGYGYQFWRNQKGGYVCYGMGGQLIIFLPEYDMICVTTADTQGIGGGNQLIYDALYEEILPFISKNPLPVNSGTYSNYYEVLATLQIEPLKGSVNSPIINDARIKKSAVYHVSENPMGFSKLSVSFAPSKTNAKNSGSTHTAGTLHFTLRDKDYSFTFGLGYLETGIFPVYDLNYAASGIWFDKTTLYIKVHIIDEYVGSVKFELAFGQNDVTVFMKKQEESLFQEFNGHLYCTI
ncbi:MAG: serine hydrolase domain-containing protein [Suilimivivens sp.]